MALETPLQPCRSFAEIGAEMGISAQAAHGAYARAVKKLGEMGVHDFLRTVTAARAERDVPQRRYARATGNRSGRCG